MDVPGLLFEEAETSLSETCHFVILACAPDPCLRPCNSCALSSYQSLTESSLPFNKTSNSFQCLVSRSFFDCHNDSYVTLFAT